MSKFFRITGIIMIFFVVTGLSPAWAAPFNIGAKAAVLMDAATGQILYEKNIHTRLAPASTTKIMTAIIALESGRLKEQVKVSARAAGTGGSSMHLYAGQIITLGELVTGLMLRSGNDAAVAIAEHLAGSTDAFVDIMNRKAHELGAYNTHFRNPHGLTAPGHFSTAFDLAWLTRYALANPLFSEIVATKETEIEWLDRRGRSQDRNLRNTNKLLWMLEDADGVKTGTTGEAGPCLVSSATRDNQRLIAVVLHDHSRWYDSMKLLEYGFANFELFSFAAQGDTLGSVPVENGTAQFTDAAAAAHAALVVPAADYAKVTVEVDLPEKIKAPVYKGQKIGEIIFFVDNKAVKIVDIISNQEVETNTFVRSFLNQLFNLFRFLSRYGL